MVMRNISRGLSVRTAARLLNHGGMGMFTVPVVLPYAAAANQPCPTVLMNV